MTPIDQRFWAKVDKSDDPDACWLWTAGKDRRGYGKLGRGGRGAGIVSSHRFSFEIHNGPIPAGMSVLHRCDTPACCNPRHLFLGTQADNMRDMSEKGRTRGQQRDACAAGHRYTPESTAIALGRSGRPVRRCRICTNITMRRRRKQRATPPVI